MSEQLLNETDTKMNKTIDALKIVLKFPLQNLCLMGF